jgi:hypothetical protein
MGRDARVIFRQPPQERPHRDTRDDELDLWPDGVELLAPLSVGFGLEPGPVRDTRDE